MKDQWVTSGLLFDGIRIFILKDIFECMPTTKTRSSSDLICPSYAEGKKYLESKKNLSSVVKIPEICLTTLRKISEKNQTKKILN